MFRTLRGKLISSYALLVLLMLVLSGVVTAVLVTRYQRSASLRRSELAAIALAQRIGPAMGMGMHMTDLFDRLETEGDRLRLRTFVLDAEGKILYDSDDTYVGQVVPPPQGRQSLGLRMANVQRHTFSDGREYFVVFVPLGQAPGGGALKASTTSMAVALEIEQVDPPWRQLLAPLLAVGAITLALAVVLGVLLANSITRPVRQMTQAAQEMAQGRYDQRIAVRGDDEIARLGRTFTEMSGEVARAQRAQREFLANISHDLRTPLTSVRGFSQAILEGAITDVAGYKRAAEIIQQESEHMGHLVDDLLELARIESRQLEVTPRAVPLSDVVRAEMRKAAPRAEQRHARIVDALPSDLPPLKADVHRLGQAFGNLLDNAIKYGAEGEAILVDGQVLPAGTPRPAPLTVGFGEPVDEGDWVEVTITNQGEPIAADELSRLFERFYRGDPARQRSEGSGLGLAIARETILAHDGRIEASSDAAQGTRFRIWLPQRP